MKGKLLYYQEVENLKEGDKVYIEYEPKEFNYTINGIEKMRNGCFLDSRNNLVPLQRMLDWYTNNLVKIYEWIEDEQTITKEIDKPKTYKGSEIIHMIENGELKNEDMIIDKDNYPWIIKSFTIEDDEECNPTYTLLNYAPFTIKKQKPVDFMTAYNSHKKVKPVIGEYIYSDMIDYLKVIESSTQSIADGLVNGKWLIQE